jgi:prolyl oligopeptidase PreP (S9A serine peptidase family)
MSPSRPTLTIIAVTPRRYARTTHCTAGNDAPNASASVGSATFVTLVPREDNSIGKDRPANVHRAAEWLITHKYTSPEKLGIHGVSNGGLLVGAVANQRPELFSAVIQQAGVMDMLRFHKFTIGSAWIPDYGSSESNEAEFKALRAYSPVHNVKVGAKYPATLITTADHDDRVVPAHSFKYAAALQAGQGGDAPILIRIDTKSGHGASSTTKALEQTADLYSFIFWNLGVTPRFDAALHP